MEKNKKKEVNLFEVVVVGILFTGYIYSFQLIPVLFPFFATLSPIFGALLAAFFYRNREGMIALIIIPLVFGLSAKMPLGLYLIFGLPPIISAVLMKKEYRLEQTTLINTIITVVGCISLAYWLINSVGVDFQGTLDEIKKQYILYLEESLLFDSQMLDTIILSINEYMETIKQLGLAILVIVSIILATVQSYLARVFVTLFKWKQYDLKRPFYYSLPKSTLIFYLLCYIIMEISDKEAIHFICFTLVVVLIFLVTLNGISYCLYHVIRVKEIGIRILLLFVIPFLTLALPPVMVIMGAIDTLLHKRKAIK